MFGNLGNLTGLLKGAKELQANIARMQEEMAKKRYEGDAGGGMVRVTVDGKCNPVEVSIEPDAARDVELLEDLVKAAVGSAVQRAHEGMKEEMSKVTGGMNLPGLSDMMGG